MFVVERLLLQKFYSSFYASGITIRNCVCLQVDELISVMELAVVCVCEFTHYTVGVDNRDLFKNIFQTNVL